MMNKLRWNDPDFKYGDEYIYDVETDSEYSESGSDSGSDTSERSDWEEAWDVAIFTLREDTGHDDLSIPLGTDWSDIVASYLMGDMSREEIWDIIDGEAEDSRRWERGQESWSSAVNELNSRE